MSEWKKQVADKARLTAIEYVLEKEPAAAVSKAGTGRSKSRGSVDMVYGLFALFMAIAMALIALGFHASATGSYVQTGERAAVVYLILCLVMTVSGIRSIISGLR